MRGKVHVQLGGQERSSEGAHLGSITRLAYFLKGGKEDTINLILQRGIKSP